MSYIDNLKKEIVDDPLGRYLGLSNKQVADSLNDKNIDNHVRVQLSTVEGYLWNKGVLFSIIGHGQSAGDTPGVIAAKMLDRLLIGKLTEIDVHAANFIGGIDALIADNILTLEHKNDILGLGNKPISRAEQLKLQLVKEGHVEMAKAK